MKLFLTPPRRFSPCIQLDTRLRGLAATTRSHAAAATAAGGEKEAAAAGLRELRERYFDSAGTAAPLAEQMVRPLKIQ